jgi:hypothetical protein
VRFSAEKIAANSNLRNLVPLRAQKKADLLVQLNLSLISIEISQPACKTWHDSALFDSFNLFPTLSAMEDVAGFNNGGDSKISKISKISSAAENNVKLILIFLS